MNDIARNPEIGSNEPFFQRLEREWKNFEGGKRNGELYLDILDRFLLRLLASDMLEEQTSEALNQRYLTLMYPNGENTPKRNPSEVTSDEVKKNGLNPHTLSAFLGERAIGFAGATAEYIEGLVRGDKKGLH